METSFDKASENASERGPGADEESVFMVEVYTFFGLAATTSAFS
jgi:hypothetical protein